MGIYFILTCETLLNTGFYFENKKPNLEKCSVSYVGIIISHNPNIEF